MTDSSNVYLAADLGASSGRVVAGLFDGSRLKLEEVHRFDNGGIVANDRMYWNLLEQWQQITMGLRAAGKSLRRTGLERRGRHLGCGLRATWARRRVARKSVPLSG